MSEPVLIIGGGPAGLSLAWELQRLGVASRVLEAGPVAGASWAKMPEHMKLLSPWFQNVLFDRRTSLRDRFSLQPAQKFADYLRASAEQHDLRIETGVAVRRVLASGDGFEVLTDAGARQSRLLVNATGYFAKPWMPTLPGMESTAIPLVHFHDFQNAASLVERFGLKGLRALVVGSRVSGGQLVEELHEAGFKVTIACREALRFSRPPWMQAATFPFYFAVEDWIARRNPLSAARHSAADAGGPCAGLGAARRGARPHRRDAVRAQAGALRRWHRGTVRYRVVRYWLPARIGSPRPPPFV